TQRDASPVASTRRVGGLPGCRSTLSIEVGDEYVISAPSPFASSSHGRAGSCAAAASDGRWSRRHSPLRPAIDQFRVIGEERLTDEALEGNRAVKDNRQLQNGKRRAPEVEKVIPSADLVLGDAEHLRPRGRQAVLGRRNRPIVALLGDIELRG